MRLFEFELTEDELFELKMSPTNLSKMAKNIDARVGMEFELIVPGVENPDNDEYESEPDYDADESFPTGPGWIRDVVDFFRGGEMGNSRSTIERQIDALNEDFYSWVDEDQEEYINSTVGQDRIRSIAMDNVDRDDYDTDEEYVAAIQAYIEENEGDIRDQLVDEYNEDLDSKFEEWLDDQGINTMADFANEYNLDWPYWSEPEYYGSGGGADIDTVADDFSQAIGRPVNAASSYHGATRQPGHYVVEPDGSLQGEQGETGLEFVSPVLTVDEMLSDIDKVVKWAGRAGAYTNSSTGLHINVSVPDQQNLDYVKLAMFLGDNYILEQFGRAGNHYCKSALQKIKIQAGSNPDRVEEMMRQFQGGLNELASKILHTGSTEKFTSINNRNDWVEFRGPGGDWMTGDAGITTVKNTLLRAVVALDVATKPAEFKQEYYKKLYKTLNPKGDDDSIQYFARYAAGELPQSALKAFVRQIQGKRKANKLALGAKDILLVWKVVGSQNSPYQSQGVEVVAMDELGAYKEAIKKWSLNLGGNSIEDYTQQNGWRAQPVRAATSDDMNKASNKIYRVAVGGRPDLKVYVKAMSEYQAKTLAVQRHADVFANVTFDDMVAIHDPDYSGEETAVAAMRARSGEPVPAGSLSSRDQEYAGQWEFVSRATDEVVGVVNLNSNSVADAEASAAEWARSTGFDDPIYVRPRMRPRNQAAAVPGSTNDLARQRLAAQMPALNTVDGNWEIYSIASNNTVYRFTANTEEEAVQAFRIWQDALREPSLSREGFNLRTTPGASPRAQPQQQAQSRESLPAGNARWRILDQDGDEVYSFINTTAQRDANEYARNWMINTAPSDVRNRGPFTIVPAIDEGKIIGDKELVDIYLRGRHRGEMIEKKVGERIPNKLVNAFIDKVAAKFGLHPSAFVYGPCQHKVIDEMSDKIHGDIDEN